MKTTILEYERFTSCYPEDVSLASIEISLIALDNIMANELNAKLENTVLELIHKRHDRITAEISSRIKNEIKTISSFGLAHVFLSLYEIINWMETQKIQVGAGIGTLPCSFVAYTLGITNIDPIQNGLFFERLLNLNRSFLPIFYLEVCYNRRKEVVSYIESKIQYVYIDTTAPHYSNNKLPMNINIEIFGSKVLSKFRSIIITQNADRAATSEMTIPQADDATLTRMLTQLLPQKHRLARFVSNDSILDAEKDKESFVVALNACMVYEQANYFEIKLQKDRNLLTHDKSCLWETRFLADTFGYVLFDEQVISIIIEVSGYTISAADQLRRELWKKNAVILSTERINFIKASSVNGYTEKQSGWIFDFLLNDSGYTFSKSSVLCQVQNQYRLYYLEVHYPEWANTENTMT